MTDEVMTDDEVEEEPLLSPAEMKSLAIEAMQKLDIYKPYITGFKKSDKVCFFEGYGGYWVDQEPEIEAKMKELEERFGFKVYAITHEFTNFGEIYDFLYVSQYPDEADDVVEEAGNNKFYAHAYAWNKSEEMFSDIGGVVLKSFGGGIARVG